MYNAEEFRAYRNRLSAEIEADRTPEETAQADETRAQRAAYEALPNETQKELKELEVFNAFADVNELHVDSGSATNAKPPKPDIMCTINGEPRYFELGEIADQQAAQCAANALKRMELQGTVFGYSQVEPFYYIVQKKCRTTYETSGVPVELILYYRSQSPPPRLQFEELLQRSMACLESVVSRRQFQSLWIYDFAKKRTLWHSEAD